MSKFIIKGGKSLSGQIAVSGAKNAVFPLMAAALMTDEECVLTNVPEIKDKQVMVDIFRDMGVDVTDSPGQLSITAKDITKQLPNPELVGKLRGSILILGALLGRLGKIETAYPGGDRIGSRPIGSHVEAFKALGATVEVSERSIKVFASKLIGSKIVLEETSVLGTENAILAAVLAEGRTVIKLAAMEPHVQQLCEFLNLMGAKITGIATPTIIIDGVKKLNGASIRMIADSEEAASLITLGVATKSNIKVTGLNPDFLEDYLLTLKKMNVKFTVGEDYVETSTPESDYKGTKIQCGFYPKLNSDFLPPMSVIATQASGSTIMYEWLYENRLGHIPELVKMGAVAEILDPHRVKITGPTPLRGQKITTYDLRMGITLVIAALVADGESEINDIHHIDRGYVDLEGRLERLGADIKRVE